MDCTARNTTLCNEKYENYKNESCVFCCIDCYNRYECPIVCRLILGRVEEDVHEH